MKELVVLLGLVTATLLLGVAATIGRIRAYNATGEVDIRSVSLFLGTRVNLTCNVTSPPNDSEVLKYRWYHNCKSQADNSCEIQNGDTYRVRNDTLSMNVTSYDQEGPYTCAVQYPLTTVIVPGPFISVAGGTKTPTTPTPVVTSASPTPTKVVSRESPTSPPVVNTTPMIVSTTSTARSTSNSSPTPSGPQNFSRIPFNTQPVGKLSKTQNKNAEITTPTPLVSREGPTSTPVVSREGSPPMPAFNSRNISAPTQVFDKTITTSTPVVNTTPTTVSTTTTARSTSNSSPTSSGPQNFSRNPFNTQPVGTFVGVGVGVGMFLLVLLTSVVLLVLVVVVARRKGANEQKRGTPLRDNLWCDNSVVAEQEMEMIKKGVTADNGDGYDDVDYNDKCEDDDPVEDVVNHYEFADRNENITNTNIPAQKEPFTSASATNVPVVYTVVDKSKKKEPKAMAEIGSFATNNVQYAMPMKKGGKMTHKEVVGVICAVEEEQYDDTVVYKPKEEQYDDTVAYKPKADSKIW